MNELQVVIYEEKLFIWGFSSDYTEIFTPVNIIKESFFNLDNELSKQYNIIEKEIELPKINDIPLVPISMRLFYSQYSLEKLSFNFFKIKGIEVNKFYLIKNFLNTEKHKSIVFGSSILFLKQLLKFAYSLVSKERFIPYIKKNKSYFISNLDLQEDQEIYNDLINNCPLNIRQNNSIDKEKLIKSYLDFFVNNIILESLIGINIKNKTQTDKWLNGLFGNDEILDKKTVINIKEWFEVKKIEHNLNYNMLFKLIEPEEDDNWNLYFNLQSKKDPSFIISLKDLWSGDKKIDINNIKVSLLKDLGIASNYSKIIENALYTSNPYKINLKTDEAYKFITDDSLLLKDAGFVVQIPKINFKYNEKIKAKIKFKGDDKLKISGTGSIGKTLFDFDYTISIDGEEITKEEFYNLSKSKEKLVKIKNKWVEINVDEINKVIKFFEKKEKISIYDTFIINSEENIVEIDDVIIPVEFQKEINGLFDIHKIKDKEIPKSLNGILRNYQKEGFSWMYFLRNAGFGGILADDMGLGKTIQTISYFLSLNNNKPSLIICPMSVMVNWKKEIYKFAPTLSVHIHHGSERLKKEELHKKMKDINLIISSFSTIRNDEKIFEDFEFDTIIIDEAQNIKNPFTKQSISINKLKSLNKFCLTGTPIENRLSEFWAIMNFVNPGLLSNWNLFKKKFAEPIELYNDNKKSDLLKKIITPFIMRRLKTDKKVISDLPNKTEIKEYCLLTKEQASLYQAVVDDSLEKLNNEENRRTLIMATLIKLKQICNHPSNYLKDSINLFDRSKKVLRLRELVEIFLKNNEKCLIFTQYKEMGDLLKRDLEEYFDMPVCFLHGGLNTKIREKLIELFQSDDIGSPKVFILSLKAGGTGINLTKANHVIHFDRWWNPAVENQATDRAFRIGQKKDVFIYKFITNGTIEEKIDELLERKLNLSEQVLSKGEKSITEFNNDELKEFFSLRKEAFNE